MVAERYDGLILDFAGVMTSNMVEVIDHFEHRERLRRGVFLRAWADPRGQDLYRRLELGEIDQRDWNAGFGALIGVDPSNLMGRVLYALDPAYEVLNVLREARAAGIRTAVLSNSLGTDPHDPYLTYNLHDAVDHFVLSTDLKIRKPDPAIFEYTLERLGVAADRCVFADDTEANLVPAQRMGMTVIHALDEDETSRVLRALFGLPAT
ncbi:phosphoglycolate phosphatase [Pilimelia terevasa]|uniref:Phosphoglycolate phosphatase n=1 Tax=Pilimelia terevasa TaxID=53372 RepID=A0A8J3BVG7_9ACTN|nr:HAD-IA family hydrolase [Pilimelia terevasa]GGK36417.1 phosphoglycolate phosphatase [Pilimelia terevasa]